MSGKKFNRKSAAISESDASFATVAVLRLPPHVDVVVGMFMSPKASCAQGGVSV